MQLDKLVGSIQDIPTLSTVALKINSEINKESLTADSLAKIISSDPSLLSKILRIANSAYYGLSGHVKTPQRAITVLGLNAIQSLSLTVSVFGFFSESKSVIDFPAFWHHSLGTAVASKTIAASVDLKSGEKAFICGLLHDIGKIVMAFKIPDALESIIALMNEKKIPQSLAEEEILGYNHQKIGSELAATWHFPEEYGKAVLHHHETVSPGTEEERPEAILINSVYAGNQIAKAAGLGESMDQKVHAIPKETLQFLGISDETLPEIINTIKDNYQVLIQSLT